MRTILMIYLVLALTQVSQVQQEITPESIMEMVVAKSIADRNIVREKYLYDKKVTGKDEEGRDKLEISELFQRGRYNYQLSETKPFQNEMAYVITFSPKPEKEQLKAPPGSGFVAERKNEILNCLKGTVYVSADNFGIIRAETHTNSSKESIWAVGRLYQMDGLIEQVRIGDLWVPRKITASTAYTYTPVPWPKLRKTSQAEFSNFRLKAP